jgi:hypothetical protein
MTYSGVLGTLQQPEYEPGPFCSAAHGTDGGRRSRLILSIPLGDRSCMYRSQRGTSLHRAKAICVDQLAMTLDFRRGIVPASVDTLFHNSRSRKLSPNDADRLRKYLSRFGLDWNVIAGKRGRG